MTARCRLCGIIIPSLSRRRCAYPRRSRLRCESRVRCGSQTNAVRTLSHPPVCRRRLFRHVTFRLSPHLDSEYSLYGFLAWVSYLNMAILIGTLSVALFNASKDPIARKFAYVYSAISVGILVRTSSFFFFGATLCFR